MPTTRRTQPEPAVAANAEIVRLASSINHHPIAVNQRLRVLHPRLRAAERAVTPNYWLRADDHELFASHVGERGGLVQDGIENSLRGTLPFTSVVFPVGIGAGITDGVTVGSRSVASA